MADDPGSSFSLRCSFSNFSNEKCNICVRFPQEAHIIKLSDCKKDIIGHLRTLKLSVGSDHKGFKTANSADNITSEADLICRRVGLFSTNLSMTVCPYHRFRLGIGFRQGKTCVHPLHAGSGKTFRGVSSMLSQAVLERHGVLVPVGSGICFKCYSVQTSTLRSETLKENISQGPSEAELAELVSDVDVAERKINDWKCHVLRAMNQEMCRKETLQELGEGEALLILDWAMKFLPMLHRETQSDWFGQKGFSWHVIVAIFKDTQHKLKHRTYVHTMEAAKQDWFSVASILEHTLHKIRGQLPQISQVQLRSDNAGCYHCRNLWHSLHDISARTGIIIRQYNFSESQHGKSYCDSKIAHMRGRMKKFVAEGGNVSSASGMKEALDINGGVTGCQIAHVTINTAKQTSDSSSIKGITKITNVQLEVDSTMTCWRAYKVGAGRTITANVFNQPATEIIVHEDFRPPVNAEGAIKASQEVDSESTSPSTTLLFCPENMCDRKFSLLSDLEDHCLFGDHTQPPTHDAIKLRWKDACLDISSSTMKYREGGVTEGGISNTLVPGWALKRDRKNTRFSDKVRCYLKGVFDAGEKEGRKANPHSVSQNMRVCRDEDGKKMFSPEEYLQTSQIASYFSRLAVQAKQPSIRPVCISDEDLESAIALINKSEALMELPDE